MEIERANSALYTRKGDPTAFLTHAIRQVQDWKRWVNANREYVVSAVAQRLAADCEAGRLEPTMRAALRQALDYGFVARYVVLAGRRAKLRIADRCHMSQLNDDTQNIWVMTYDTLLEGLLDRIERGHMMSIIWSA